MKLPKLPRPRKPAGLPKMLSLQLPASFSDLPTSLSELPKLRELKLPARIDVALAHGEAIVNELRLAARTRAKDYAYDIDTLRSFAQLAGSGATLWLAYQRKRAALYASSATSAIVLGLSLAQPKKRANPIDLVLDNLSNVLGTITLATSAGRAETPFPLDLTPRDPSLPFTPTETLRNVTSLFAAYTIVGHWAEMLFCQLIRLGIVGGDYDRSNEMLWDWWLHPFPAEGLAALFIAFVGAPLSDKLLAVFGNRIAPTLAVSFLATQVACTAIDYLTGMVANRNYELWDYRDMPFNFQGQICLQNSIVYSTAATLLAWVAYPLRENWLRTIPSDIANTVFSGFMSAYAFVCLLYFT